MVDISVIAGAITSLRGASDIAKAMLDIRDHAAMQSKVIELQRMIVDALSSAAGAQSEQLNLVEQIRGLQAELAKMEAWAAERARYQLEMLPPGVALYGLRRGQENGEPDHKLCSKCFNEGRKTILHSRQSSGQTIWHCPHCGSDQYTGQRYR